MKHLRIFVLLLILISSFFVLQVIQDKNIINEISEITTKTILNLNTKATAVLASLSVNVDIDFPKIYIDSPLNQTYTTTSIDLKFTIVENNLDKVYYNIDDGTNVTVTSNITFSTTLGSHTLKLFANDTLGKLNISSVTFAVIQAAGGGAGEGGAGGGGGGGKAILSDFNVSTDLIKVSLLQGETKKESIEIQNTGTTVLNLDIDLENIKDFLIFPGGVGKYTLVLKPGEKQTVQLIFNVAKDYKPGIYTGKIIISSPSIKKIIPAIIEVESSKKIFDVDIKIQNKEVIKGNNLVTEIILFNLGKDVGRVDINVESGIKDLEGNVIIKEQTIVATETQASFTQSILVPKYLQDGRYIFYATVTFDHEIGTATEVFEVISKPEGFVSISTLYIYLIPGLISIIILLIILIYKIKRRLVKGGVSNRIKERTKIKIKKLKRK